MATLGTFAIIPTGTCMQHANSLKPLGEPCATEASKAQRQRWGTASIRDERPRCTAARQPLRGSTRLYHAIIPAQRGGPCNVDGSTDAVVALNTCAQNPDASPVTDRHAEEGVGSNPRTTDSQPRRRGFALACTCYPDDCSIGEAGKL